jgi:thiosulfate/3-mercaptopyruvate sulfurtransferase
MISNAKGFTNPHLIVTPEDLAREIDGRSAPALLLDVRPADEFAAGHLPEAVHLDLMGLTLIDTDPAPLKAFVWMIERLLAARGVAADRPVVVYEETSGMRAARAFWFLEYFGHPDVRLLDGGSRAWGRAGLPVTTQAIRPRDSHWTGVRDDTRIATWRDVQQCVDSVDAAIVDARSDGEYLGTQAWAARGGAIPGAVHIEWTRNVGEDGAFKPAPELRRMYNEAGVTPDREVVVYCQGGYRSAHTCLALRLLGYPRVRNYIGSWKEWGDRLDLPIEHPKEP